MRPYTTKQHGDHRYSRLWPTKVSHASEGTRERVKERERERERDKKMEGGDKGRVGGGYRTQEVNCFEEHSLLQHPGIQGDLAVWV